MLLRAIFYGGVSATALAVPGLAIAQNATPQAATGQTDDLATDGAAIDQGMQLGEIVVTANKRSERAQSVPISIAAISGEQLAARGVLDVLSLSDSVPGLRVNSVPGSATPYVRGVGSPSATVGSEPSVSVYVDDVYIASGSALFSNFNNIDRVEVLKGPQGTLFGRNATGGVIQVFTKNPSAEPQLDVSAGYANYETISGSLYASGGIANGVSANISLYGSHQGKGWGKNILTGKDANDVNWNKGGRVKFLVEPSSATRILLTVDHDVTATSQGIQRPIAGSLAYGFVAAPEGFYDRSDSLEPYFRAKQSGISAKVSHDMDWASLVSITAYRDLKQRLDFNQGAVPFPGVIVNIDSHSKTFTQEFQVLSPEASPIKWLAGVYYMRDSAAYDPLVLQGELFGPVMFEGHSKQKTKSYSGFAQTTIPITEKTHLTAGLRYTADKKEIDARYSVIVNLPPPFGDVVSAPAPNSPQSKSFKKITWRAALDHQFTRDLMVYASYNRGFKSGGFNTVIFPSSPISAPFDPETLDAFAIGEKAEFLNRRLQINAEAFYYSYKNIQINRAVTGGAELTNAATAKIKGIDLDIRAIPVPNLTLTASFEYLHARFDDYPDGVLATYNPGCVAGSSNCTSTIDLSGFKMPNASPFTASLSANYLHESSVGDFNFNVAYSHGGNYYFDPDNGIGQPDRDWTRQKSLDLVNASLKWTSLDRRFDVAVWGRNITDQKYVGSGTAQSIGTTYAAAPPATYGVTFGVHLR